MILSTHICSFQERTCTHEENVRVGIYIKIIGMKYKVRNRLCNPNESYTHSSSSVDESRTWNDLFIGLSESGQDAVSCNLRFLGAFLSVLS